MKARGVIVVNLIAGDLMSKNDSTLDAVTKLLELAREFENKGDIQSALMTYNHALSQLPAESPLKKEIEIIILQLEGRSVSVGRTVPPKNTSQLWKIGTAFLVGLLFMGVIALAIISFKASQVPTPVYVASPDTTNTPAFVASPDATSTPTFIVPQITARASETAEPVQKNFLTIKSNRIYLRTGPDMDNPYISKVYPNGTQMEILGKYNDWFKVKSPNDEIGWVFKDFVIIDPSLINSIPIITPIPTSIPTRAVGYPNS